MSSIYDALKRVQNKESTLLSASDSSKSWKNPRNWAIIIITVTLSSVLSMSLFYLLTNQEKPVKKPSQIQSATSPPAPKASAPQVHSQSPSGPAPTDTNILIAPSRSRDEYINLANGHFSRKDYDKAISVYREALGIYKNDAGLLNNLGAVMLAKHDLDGAIRYFKVAIMCSKDKVEPVYNLACAYALKGEGALALNELNRALSMGGDEVRKWAQNDPDLDSIKGKWN